MQTVIFKSGKDLRDAIGRILVELPYEHKPGESVPVSSHTEIERVHTDEASLFEWLSAHTTPLRRDDAVDILKEGLSDCVSASANSLDPAQALRLLVKFV